MRRLTPLLLVLGAWFALLAPLPAHAAYYCLSANGTVSTLYCGATQQAACDSRANSPNMNQQQLENGLYRWVGILAPVCNLHRQGVATGVIQDHVWESWAVVSAPEPSANCAAQAGQKKIVNVTSAWARTSTPNAPDIVIDLMPTAAHIVADRCVGGCVAQYFGDVEAWRSQVPAANGLHRLSVDVEMVVVNQTCTTQTAGADPSTPTPPCPGSLGSVNGKPVCVGTAGSPITEAPRTTGPATEAGANPSAGGKPTTGAGSGSTGAGRTPVSGNGGNAGGPSGAATPGGGSGGNGQTWGGSGGAGLPAEIEIDTCGLPGKPPCRIDETGTPSGDGAFGGAQSALDTVGQGAVNAVTAAGGAAGKDTAWGFSFSLPTGCSPLDLPALSLEVDMCRWQPVIHDLMSLVWIAGTLFLVIGMVGRAFGGGNS
jgi:hypothetical protein